jgi:hypothetical protein
MNKSKLIALVALLGLIGFGSSALAADHLDSPAVDEDPTTDITDLYAWMQDDDTLNLAVNTFPMAGESATFSTEVQYVFHILSDSGVPSLESEMTTVICQFYDENAIECWAGDEDYVEGDPSSEAGLSNQDDSINVFAGLRNDPFFMEFLGFQEAVSTAVAAYPGLDKDAAMCPDIDSETSGTLVGQLQGVGTGDTDDASDTFAGTNVLSLVLQVDLDIVNGGGDNLAVFASTNTVE